MRLGDAERPGPAGSCGHNRQRVGRQSGDEPDHTRPQQTTPKRHFNGKRSKLRVQRFEGLAETSRDAKGNLGSSIRFTHLRRGS